MHSTTIYCTTYAHLWLVSMVVGSRHTQAEYLHYTPETYVLVRGMRTCSRKAQRSAKCISIVTWNIHRLTTKKREIWKEAAVCMQDMRTTQDTTSLSEQHIYSIRMPYTTRRQLCKHRLGTLYSNYCSTDSSLGFHKMTVATSHACILHHSSARGGWSFLLVYIRCILFNRKCRIRSKNLSPFVQQNIRHLRQIELERGELTKVMNI